MKLVFYDKSEAVMEIVTDVLSGWNVPYKIKENRQQGFFSCSRSYDIVVDIDYEFYLYLDKEINKEITNRIHLEDCYAQPCAKPAARPELDDIGKEAAEQFDKAIETMCQNISKKLDEKINEKKKGWTHINHPRLNTNNILNHLFPNRKFDILTKENVAKNGLPQELINMILPDLKDKNVRQIITETPDGLAIHIEVEDDE